MSQKTVVLSSDALVIECMQGIPLEEQQRIARVCMYVVTRESIALLVQRLPAADLMPPSCLISSGKTLVNSLSNKAHKGAKGRR